MGAIIGEVIANTTAQAIVNATGNITAFTTGVGSTLGAGLVAGFATRVIGNITGNETETFLDGIFEASSLESREPMDPGMKISLSELEESLLKLQARQDPKELLTPFAKYRTAIKTCLTYYFVEIPKRWFTKFREDPTIHQHASYSEAVEKDPSLKLFDADPSSSFKVCVSQELQKIEPMADLPRELQSTFPCLESIKEEQNENQMQIELTKREIELGKKVADTTPQDPKSKKSCGF